jgi:fumarylpyruvate hydrolase
MKGMNPTGSNRRIDEAQQKISRRRWLRTTAAAGAGAAASCASSAGEQAGGEILFAPPHSTIPIHGTNQQFAVRRIYCVGRNYAARPRDGVGSDA